MDLLHFFIYLKKVFSHNNKIRNPKSQNPKFLLAFIRIIYYIFYTPQNTCTWSKVFPHYSIVYVGQRTQSRIKKIKNTKLVKEAEVIITCQSNELNKDNYSSQ